MDDLLISLVRGIGTLMQLLGYLLVVRALLSWFPNARENQLVQYIYEFTDPIIIPLRRIIPPIGMIDLSVMIAVFFLLIVGSALGGLLAY